LRLFYHSGIGGAYETSQFLALQAVGVMISSVSERQLLARNRVGSFPGHDRLGGSLFQFLIAPALTAAQQTVSGSWSVYRNSRAAVPRVRRRSPVFARFRFQKAVNPG
jgi:hypothetical protein